MIIKDTYYIKRDNTYLWTGTDFEILTTDKVIEKRPMLFADECKTLFKDGEEVGQAIWLKDCDTQDNYTEQDVVEESEEENAN